MKIFARRSMSIFLALIMIFSMMTPITAIKAEMTGSEIVTGILTNTLKAIGGRGVKELSAYSISNDVPVLGNIFYLMCDPSQRAALQNSANIAKILTSVQAIEQDIEAMDAKIDEISQKQDQNQAEILFITASNKVNGIRDKYTVAWGYYENVLTYIKQHADYSALVDTATTEATKTYYMEQAATALTTAQYNMELFINAVDLNVNINFENDLANLNNYIWKENGASTTYLGTLEGYLRQFYAFEHQITEYMYSGFQVTENMQLQIYTMYKEYMNYKKGVDTSLGEIYTNEFFTEQYNKLIGNLNAQAENSRIAELMIPDPYTDDELIDIFGTTNVDDLPEHIQSSVSINGKTYDAYKVRENTTLTYYMIPAYAFKGNEIVSKIYSEATDPGLDTGKDIYRPVFILDGLYTDDGKYKMVSSMDELPFATMWNNLRSSLRDVNGCNLSKIPENVTHLLLYSDNFVSKLLEDPYWNLTLQDAEDLSKDVTTVSSADLYSSSSYVPFVIYRSMETPSKYANNNTYVANDKGLIENQTIVVSDGQTLDISNIAVNPSNVTIIISGTGKVISNPNITLNDSQVIVTNTAHGDTVYITNLNVKAKDYQEAALTIKTPCTVAFEGTNSFIGTSSEVSQGDIYRHYVKNRPSFASHGILVNNLVTLAGVKDGIISYDNLQKLTAKGAGGGAGICLKYYNLTIKCLDVTANGSGTTFDSNVTGSGENPYSIGAGIGASVGCVIKSSGSFGVKTDHTISSYGDSSLNSANYISIENSKVSASGVKSTRRIAISDSYLGDTIYSEDIGGVKMPDNGNYYCVRAGVISNSTVAATNQRISSRIVTKNNNNIYDPEIFKITTYTKGSNGPTTDGVYFKLNGEKGSTEWMLASGCGNDKGNWSGSVKGTSVGKITSVEVKTKSSNHWYPGKITIAGTMGGESITVYGGRWIGNSGTTLSPADNIYEVTVNTSSDANSGTDAAIYLYLQDNDGTKTENIHLSDIHQYANAFEKGDSDTFWFYAPTDFGECRHAFFYSDHSNSGAGWLLDSFVIKKVQGETSDSGYTFYSDQWFEEERTINFGKYSGKTGAFYVEVKTQDSSGAGTDSDIYLTIYGDKGNTGEINLGTYAGSGNNFEKNDLDCFHIGYNKNAIGTINKIVIRKNDSGSGPDWKADYIVITEKVADGQTSQSVKFDIDRKIGDETVTITKMTNLRQTVSRIDTELLKGLQKESDGSYKLAVDRTVTVPEEVFDFIMEKDLKFTVEMQDDDKPIYSVTFDGSKIVYYEDIVLNKGYSFADGYAMLDFISNATIPEGTTIKLFLENLGFTESDKLAVFTKNENNEWEENINLISGEEIIEISLEEGKQLLINLFGENIPSETEPDEETNPGTGDTAIVQMLIICFAVAALLMIIAMKKSSKKT